MISGNALREREMDEFRPCGAVWASGEDASASSSSRLYVKMREAEFELSYDDAGEDWVDADAAWGMLIGNEDMVVYDEEREGEGQEAQVV